MPYPRDPDDLKERIEACVSNYRNGHTGPITFVAELISLGINPTDARELKSLYRDECEANRKELKNVKTAV